MAVGLQVYFEMPDTTEPLVVLAFDGVRCAGLVRQRTAEPSRDRVAE
jgi:hypothetical protein